MKKLGTARNARWMITSLVVVTCLVGSTGVALAVSGGGYSPSEQDCSPTADAYNSTGAESGCHTLKVNVESGDTRYAEVGLDQMPNGPSTPGLAGVGYPGSDNFPHAGCAAANTDGTGGGQGNECGTTDASSDRPGTGAGTAGNTNTQSGNGVVQIGAPDVAGTADNVATNGVDVYMGADDNLDAGEHDGVDNQPETGTDGTANGPSDGGAVRAHVLPGEVATTPSASNPVPVAGASFGSCADGICEDVTTYQQVLYTGGGSGSRDVANYDGKQWDPYGCSSGGLSDEQACDSGDPNGPHTMNDWRNQEGTVTAEPGVQVYEDPDPQASPIDPVHEFEDGAGVGDGSTPLYPLPGTYAGTCGVIAQGQVVVANPVDGC